jgi:hypothetical protein
MHSQKIEYFHLCCTLKPAYTTSRKGQDIKSGTLVKKDEDKLRIEEVECSSSLFLIVTVL